MLKIIQVISVILITSIFSTTYAMDNGAPDATARGPHDTAEVEYKLPATVDKDILDDRETEIWGKMYFPKDIAYSSKKLPLVIMLHGNHSTCGTGNTPRHDNSCEYTDSGICPEGSVVVPSHEGYRYLADHLASWGMVVVSINANRGINCGDGVENDDGLNLARGRLVLKHLSWLHQWVSTGGAPESLGVGSHGLLGKLNFSEVGLFGHSRGGEGMRAAFNLYLDKDSPWPAKIPGLRIKAIYEVGAVDGQTSRVLDATGVVWNQLLPMCDGDVSNLEGRYPFERMLRNKSEPANAQKSLYEVWGANHNFFNTEWQESDSRGCQYGKAIFASQRTIALASVSAFFCSHLGDANTVFNRNFNPLVSLPAVVSNITQVDKDFTATPHNRLSWVVDDFNKETGTNSSGQANLASRITINHIDLDDWQRAAFINWDQPGRDVFFETVWATAGKGKNIRDYATLDIRVGRDAADANNAATDFSIVLIDAKGHASQPVAIGDYALINGPGSHANALLLTARIPLSAFKKISLGNIHSVRFVFDRSATGHIYLANVRVHKSVGLGGDAENLHVLPFKQSSHLQLTKKPTTLEVVPISLNTISVLSKVKDNREVTQSGEKVEILVTSKIPFNAMNRLPELRIGNQSFFKSRYKDKAKLTEMIFVLTAKQYQQLPKNADISVINGKIWKFGQPNSSYR